MKNFNFEEYDYSVLDKYVSANRFKSYIFEKTTHDLKVIEEMCNGSKHLKKLPLIDILAHSKELNLEPKYYDSVNKVYSLYYFLETLSKKSSEPPLSIVSYIESDFVTMSDFMANLENALNNQVNEKYVLIHIDDDEFIHFSLSNGVGNYVNSSKVLAVFNVEASFLDLLNVSKSEYAKMIWNYFNWHEFSARIKCNICEGCE